MSKTTKSSIVSALVAALLTTLLVGTFSIAGADEPADARTTTIGYYLRGTTYACTGDVMCFTPEIVIRCKAGDFATGGSAWLTDNPAGQAGTFQSRPWRKNGAARGWVADPGVGIGPGDHVDVQVICAKQA